MAEFVSCLASAMYARCASIASCERLGQNCQQNARICYVGYVSLILCISSLSLFNVNILIFLFSYQELLVFDSHSRSGGICYAYDARAPSSPLVRT